MDRRDFLGGSLGTLAAGVFAAADTPPAANLGLLIYSYGIRGRAEKEAGFGEPARFVAFAHSRGANAVQMPLGVRPEADALAIRRQADKLGMAIEGIVRLPDGPADRERFGAELTTLAQCGGSVARVVLLGGRRYEVFTKADEFAEFARRSEATLKLAEPVAGRAKVILAVENHKDFRTDELLDLLRKVPSEWLGICLDTGNNLALLEEPQRVVEALAPLTRTVHLKDMAVEPADDGFRLAEVPLGQGLLDLPAIFATLRKANPKVRFQLEMMTRDPLSIPCLGEKYWATLDRVPARDLARTLALVRRLGRKEPLPRVGTLEPKEQLALEDRNVAESMRWAASR